MTELRLAQLSVDMTKGSMEVKATAAIVDPATGVSCWHKGEGNVWSKETQKKLTELMQAMEEDLARAVMADATVLDGTKPAEPRRAVQAAGLGEHVGGDGVPQM